ncbi:MAG: S23 ribosomal protein family protein [Candidatus Moranbacteria bacterium GW2011_GWF2_34_56]|nr:MAG: S23 ribosomal protein family protein [Candidatus Moranbacteria bacterium GW2011_GWF1_34_10]KKP65315.1 MAG: S23 ribosomal protein family protein [Candidatus Moranbacteria bacterium GW2011_GWF2_34_56]HBI16572.1 four helix bundle protein [Candidatus Moranbacteria bacterium]
MSNSLNSYKDLIVWQRSMELVTEIYKLTYKFPKEEIYGIISQMKRCAISIPSNIAEGRRRDSKKEFRRFLVIAYGSGAELETQVEISKRLKFVNESEFLKTNELLLETMKMLNKLLSTLRT